MAGLGYARKPGEARRPWFYRASATELSVLGESPAAWGASLHAHDLGPQVGGFVTGFATGAPNNLTLEFVTVRDSGHMVPAYAPQSPSFKRLMMPGLAQILIVLHSQRDALALSARLSKPTTKGFTGCSQRDAAVQRAGAYGRGMDRIRCVLLPPQPGST